MDVILTLKYDSSYSINNIFGCWCCKQAFNLLLNKDWVPMDFSKILKSSGIKVTAHKIAIYELLYQHKHIDATQIINQLNHKSIEISLATVYRILSSFEQHKLISKHNFGNDQSFYEINSTVEHHDHLICTKCGIVIEFSNQQIEDLQAEIAKSNHFVISNHTLNIYGICEICQLT